MKERYHVTGMTCSACSSHVEKAVSKLAGMEKASVNLLTETMDVIYDEKSLTQADIVAAVVKAGYGAQLMEEKGAARKGTAGSTGKGEDGKEALNRKLKEDARAMKWRLGISIGFLLVLMYVSMFHMYHEWFGLPIPGFVMAAFHGNENAMTYALTQFLLLLPILYMNRKFFSVGFKTLAHRSPNMDSLIALGASAAVGYGIFAMYRISYGLGHGDMDLVTHYSHDLYFESAGMILTLITVGKYLESRSKGKTSEAITKLMDLSPKTAIVLDEEGKEKEIPTEELSKGSIFLVKPGSLVPVDGTVLEGNSSVDEAAITGESVPVEKQAGDKVVSATMNKSGFLKCRADKVGDDTTLSQIIRLVEEASASKAPIAQLADKVAGVFVPTVICIALVTLIGWLLAGAEVEFAISTAIAVLVISCPCALGLATPVAIMVGTGVGAKNGILIKSGEALQQVQEINTVVLDKTGTITEGKLKVNEVLCVEENVTKAQILALAGALEQKSEHPLAEAVVNAAEGKGTEGLGTQGTDKLLASCQVKDFKAVFGRGIQGVVAADWLEGQASKTEAGDGKAFYIGNKAFLEENQVSITKEAMEQINALADGGQTPLLVADDKKLWGVIGVSDQIKESSREAIAAWHDMGVKVIMLTGDNRRTAEAVRKQLNLEEVVAEVLPQDKEKKVSSLKSAGKKVAMIGDGINDAPALAAADVGMAIGAGTDVAMESADVILMKSDLRDAVTAMRLSRQVIRNIKENLFWAFFYNCIGIPLAAGLLYPAFGLRLNPMFGAAAMSLSSIFVVSNALRLRGFHSKFKSNGKVAENAADTEKPMDTQKKSACTPESQGKGLNECNVNQCSTQAECRQDNSCADKKSSMESEETKMEKTISIEGMMCSHCTGRVQKALEAVAGVSKVEVSLENKNAVVTLAENVADDTLKAAVTDAGYEVKNIQ